MTSQLRIYDPEKTIAVGIYGARYNFDVFTRSGGPPGPFRLQSAWAYHRSSTGWVADDTTWKSNFTNIAPARDFHGDLGHSSWLQNKDLALIYRAYATYGNPLILTSPGPCGP